MALKNINSSTALILGKESSATMKMMKLTHLFKFLKRVRQDQN